MNSDRVHAYLDGEIPREALTTAELSQAVEMERAIAETVAPLRSAPVPDLTAGVLAAIAPRLPSPRTPSLASRIIGWLWGMHTVQIRPASMLAGMAVAALAGLVIGLSSPRPPADSPLTVETGPAKLYVQFRLEAPGASTVAVSGSFTGWKPDYELTEVAPGVWSIMVPLSPGVYDYNFVVDGQQMVVDPYAPRVADSFGGSNSRLFLPAPSGPARA